MSWTDEHVSWLRNTKTISAQPSSGQLDATSTAMIDRDYGNKGALFVFNPTTSARVLTIALNSRLSLGFGKDCGGARSVD